MGAGPLAVPRPPLPERSDVGGGEGGPSGGLWDRGSQHVRAAGGARSARAGSDCGRQRSARGGPRLRPSQAPSHPGRAHPGRLGPERRETPALACRQVEGSGPAVGHGREGRVCAGPRRGRGRGAGPGLGARVTERQGLRACRGKRGLAAPACSAGPEG